MNNKQTNNNKDNFFTFFWTRQGLTLVLLISKGK